MSVEIRLKLPQTVYHEVTQLASDRKQAVEQLLLSVIKERFEPFPLDERHDLMQKEVAAYHRLHPTLVKEYFGKYVAIYGGEVVDYTDDLEDMADRLDKNYPDEVVLVRRVQDQPEHIIHYRSNRLIHDQ